jgi:hypothetical protein
MAAARPATERADETGIDPVKEQRPLASRDQCASAADSDLSAEATQSLRR